MPKEYKKLIKEAERQGWRCEYTKDGCQLYAPDGANIVTIHFTETDAHAVRNTIARMRCFGFKWKGR